jgi:hypothetical protein
MSNDETGVYLTSLIAGNVGTPGAPISGSWSFGAQSVSDVPIKSDNA